MGSVSALGVGSGIDIKQLVSDLVEAERGPRTNKLDRQENNITQKISGLATLKSALSSLQDAVTPLTQADTFVTCIGSSSEPTVFTVTADDTAVAGQYQINVVNLATANRLRTQDFPTGEVTAIGMGTLNIQVGSQLSTLNIDQNHQTLAGIRDAINAEQNTLGITATCVTVDTGTRLVITSLTTGAANTVSITTPNPTDGSGLSNTFNSNLIQMVPAGNAVFTVDSASVTSSTNVVTDVIDGVTITLLAPSNGLTDISTLSVSVDVASSTNLITNFVNAYNSFRTTLNELTAYSGGVGANGVFIGDALVRTLDSALRTVMSNVCLNSSFKFLANIGITTDQNTGLLQIDTPTLQNALATDFNDVNLLFTSEDGVAVSLSLFLEPYTEPMGPLDLREQNLETALYHIGEERETLEQRLHALESRLMSQFINMDKIIAKLKNTGDFLEIQLKSLPDPMATRRR